MDDNIDKCLYRTGEKWTNIGRWCFRIVAAGVALLAFPVAIAAARGEESEAAFMPIAFLVVLLIIGYRTVLGLRIYEDRLVIITGLSDREFPWQDIRLKNYGAFFGRVDIYAAGAIWPYMIGMSGDMKQAVKVMEQCIDRDRYGGD